MTWLIAGLAGLAGLFYGLWQRSRAKRFEVAAQRWRTAHENLLASSIEAAKRHEAVITSLKAEVARLEELSLANASPDELRRRLAGVLRPRT